MLKCNFLSLQSHKVIYAYAVLVRKGMVKSLPGYFKFFCHMISHTKEIIQESFSCCRTQWPIPLNSLFSEIGHNSELYRACSSFPVSLCTHSSLVQISLTYSMNIQQRRQSKDLAVYHFFLKSYCSTECSLSLACPCSPFTYFIGLFGVFFHK